MPKNSPNPFAEKEEVPEYDLAIMRQKLKKLSSTERLSILRKDMNLGKGSSNLKKIDLTSRESILSQFDPNLFLKLTETQIDFIVEMLIESP